MFFFQILSSTINLQKVDGRYEKNVTLSCHACVNFKKRPIKERKKERKDKLFFLEQGDTR